MSSIEVSFAYPNIRRNFQPSHGGHKKHEFFNFFVFLIYSISVIFRWKKQIVKFVGFIKYIFFWHFSMRKVDCEICVKINSRVFKILGSKILMRECSRRIGLSDALVARWPSSISKCQMFFFFNFVLLNYFIFKRVDFINFRFEHSYI